MKRMRLLLSSFVSLTLLMNFPASGLIPGWSAAGPTASAAASPFFASEEVDIIGVFENGDLAGWSSINPSEILDRKPINGLQAGEKINAIETIPGSSGPISISDHLDGLSISGISNRGNLYNIDYQTGNASFIRLISLFEGNPRLSYTYHHFTRVGLLLNVDLGMQYGINPFTGVVLSTGPTNFSYQSGDVNFGKTPRITNWEVPLVDYDLDGDTDLIATDEAQNSLVEIANNGSIRTLPRVTFETAILGGLEFECAGSQSLGVIYLHRSIPRDLSSVDLDTGQTINYGTIGDGTESLRDFIFVSEDNPLCLKPSYRKRPPVALIAWVFEGPGRSDLELLPFNFNFEVIDGPNRGVAGTGTTDANRRGAFNYTSRDQIGIDTVLVTAFVDGKSVSATSKVELTDGPIIEMVSRSGKHVIIDGFFKRGDMVDINGEMASRIKYRNCDIDDFCRQLFLKKAFRLLNENPCINNVARSNLIRAYRNPLGSPAPPVQDTSAFATCP